MINLKANLAFAAIDTILVTLIGAISVELYLAVQGDLYSLSRIFTLYEIRYALLIVGGFGVFSGFYVFSILIDTFVGTLKIVYKRMIYKGIAFLVLLIIFSFSFSDNNDAIDMGALGIIGLICVAASDITASWAAKFLLK